MDFDEGSPGPIRISAGVAPDAAARLNELAQAPDDGKLRWNPRWGGGIGADWTPGCFCCGGPRDLYANIACFVSSKEHGERIVALFEYGARLDYREHEPHWIQVKVGACARHRPLLHALVAETRSEVTTELIAGVRAAQA